MNSRLIKENFKRVLYFKKTVLYFPEGVSLFIAQSKDLRIHRGFRESNDQWRDMMLSNVDRVYFDLTGEILLGEGFCVSDVDVI